MIWCTGEQVGKPSVEVHGSKPESWIYWGTSGARVQRSYLEPESEMQGLGHVSTWLGLNIGSMYASLVPATAGVDPVTRPEGCNLETGSTGANLVLRRVLSLSLWGLVWH